MNKQLDHLNYVSIKNIPANERLIFALDVPNIEQAKILVEHLGDSVKFYKIGLELAMSSGYFELMEWLIDGGKKVFADLKFFDVPQTVGSAVRALAQHGATFATVHGNDEIMKAAAAEKQNLQILAVTVLTSLDQSDLDDLGFTSIPVKDLVLSRAKRAIALGCDGVISSGLEAADLRVAHGNGFIIICPGIRPVKNTDDQKRTVNIEEAFLNGADYIVVGRPIKDHHGFDNSRQAAEHIQTRITKVFEILFKKNYLNKKYYLFNLT